MSWQSGYSSDDPSAYPTGPAVTPSPPPVQSTSWGQAPTLSGPSAPVPYNQTDSYSLPQPVYSQAGTAAPTKTTAVLLAVFLSFWTWLYTYKTDAKKFWIGLSASIVGAITAAFVVGIFIVLGIWIWAIVDAARRPDDFYAAYPA